MGRPSVASRSGNLHQNCCCLNQLSLILDRVCLLQRSSQQDLHLSMYLRTLIFLFVKQCYASILVTNNRMYRIALLAQRTKYHFLKCDERVFNILMFKKCKYSINCNIYQEDYSIMHPSGTTHIHACACTYMLYVNYVISEHNKPQIFIANKQKSLQELMPADHAQGKKLVSMGLQD